MNNIEETLAWALERIAQDDDNMLEVANKFESSIKGVVHSISPNSKWNGLTSKESNDILELTLEYLKKNYDDKFINVFSYACIVEICKVGFSDVYDKINLVDKSLKRMIGENYSDDYEYWSFILTCCNSVSEIEDVNYDKFIDMLLNNDIHRGFIFNISKLYSILEDNKHD